MENTETNGWLDFALSCEYITANEHKELVSENEEVGKLLNHMITNPRKLHAEIKVILPDLLLL